MWMGRVFLLPPAILGDNQKVHQEDNKEDSQGDNQQVHQEDNTGDSQRDNQVEKKEKIKIDYSGLNMSLQVNSLVKQVDQVVMFTVM